MTETTTDAITEVVVNVAPGSGRIARREGVLLFDPSGNAAELVQQFADATDDTAAVTAVKQHLIDTEFASDPVVVVDWRSGGLGLIVFGDTNVQSSAPAAPMISGAGSGTWIERTLGALELGGAAEAQVWSGDDTDTQTNLEHGVVRSGGVRLAITRAVADAESSSSPDASEEPSEPPSEPEPEPEPDPEPSALEPPTSLPEPPAAIDDLQSAQDLPMPPAPAPPSTPPPAPVPSDPPSYQPAGAVAAAGAVAGAVTSNGSSAVAAGDPVPAGFVASPADLEWTGDGAVEAAGDPFGAGAPAAAESAPAPPMSSPASADVFEESITESDKDDTSAQEAAEAGVGLVEASMCVNAHPNPPRLSYCRTCGVEVDPDAAVSLIPQPAAGHIRFADGTIVELDKPHIIGRKPAGDPGTQPIIIDHAEVSRSHVNLSLEGWKVLVTDLGSRNGTWVIPPSDPTPVRLEPHVGYLLEHGTTIHLGGPEASFAYDFGTD